MSRDNHDKAILKALQSIAANLKGIREELRRLNNQDEEAVLEVNQEVLDD